MLLSRFKHVAEQQRKYPRIVVTQQSQVAAVDGFQTAPQALGQVLERPMGGQHQQLRATPQRLHQADQPLPLQGLRQIDAHQQRSQFIGTGLR
ncbi:hypothetical protein D3C87_1479390 [compost metagenome]